MEQRNEERVCWRSRDGSLEIRIDEANKNICVTGGGPIVVYRRGIPGSVYVLAGIAAGLLGGLVIERVYGTSCYRADHPRDERKYEKGR